MDDSHWSSHLHLTKDNTQNFSASNITAISAPKSLQVLTGHHTTETRPDCPSRTNKTLGGLIWQHKWTKIANKFIIPRKHGNPKKYLNYPSVSNAATISFNGIKLMQCIMFMNFVVDIIDCPMIEHFLTKFYDLRRSQAIICIKFIKWSIHVCSFVLSKNVSEAVQETIRSLFCINF